MTPLWAVQDFALGVLGYVLPWGQMGFWLAAVATGQLGSGTVAGLWSAPPALTVGARMMELLFLGG